MLRNNTLLNEKKELFVWIITAILGCSFLFPIPVYGLLSISLVIYTLIHFKQIRLKREYIILLVLSTFFILVNLYNMYRSDDLKTAFKVVETRTGLLMIPLIFLTIPFEWNNKYWNNFLRFFTVVCVTYFAYHIYNGFDIVFDRFNALSHKPTNTFSDYLSTDDFTSRLRRKTNISSRVHQVYMSLFLCWAAILSTSLFFKTRKTIYKIGHGFMAFLALICIAVLAARVSLLLTITICGAIIFIKTTLLGKKILIISIPLLLFTLYQIPSIQHRIQKLPTEFTIKNTEELTVRQTIFTCSTELLGDNWITGLGLSNLQKELNKCYQDKNSFVVERQYNTHNQYFDILLSSGILGFLSLFALIGYSLYNAIQHKNWLQFLLISIFLINFLTENVFSRFHGIMLFAFFNTAFFKMNSHNNLINK